MTAEIGSDFGRAEGVWTRLSPALRSAILLRGAPPKLCAGSSARPGAAPPRTPPRNARNRHGRLAPPPPRPDSRVRHFLPCEERVRRGGGLFPFAQV